MLYIKVNREPSVIKVCNTLHFAYGGESYFSKRSFIFLWIWLTNLWSIRLVLLQSSECFFSSWNSILWSSLLSHDWTTNFCHSLSPSINICVCVQTQKKILNGRAVTLGYCLQIYCIPILKGHAKRPAKTRIFCRNSSRKKCKKKQRCTSTFLQKAIGTDRNINTYYSSGEILRFRSYSVQVTFWVCSHQTAGIHLRFTEFLSVQSSSTPWSSPSSWPWPWTWRMAWPLTGRETLGLRMEPFFDDVTALQQIQSQIVTTKNSKLFSLLALRIIMLRSASHSSILKLGHHHQNSIR